MALSDYGDNGAPEDDDQDQLLALTNEKRTDRLDYFT